MAHGNLTAISQTSEANGAGAAVVRGNRVDAIIGGTFVATVQLQAKDAQNNWVPVGADMTTPFVRYAESAQPERTWRLFVLAFTSGTITYEISATRDRNLKS